MDQEKSVKETFAEYRFKVLNSVVNKWPMAMRVLTGARDNGMHGLSSGRRTVGIKNICDLYVNYFCS